MADKDDLLPFAFGTAALGRLKYRTAEEARGAADDLDIGGIHSHQMDVDDDGQKERFFMPGSGHDQLNESLDERGLPPKPGVQAMGSQTGGMGMGGDSAPDPMPDGFDDGAEVLSRLAPEQSRDSNLFGDRPDGASMFQFSGDSDDDGEMEIY